MLLLCNWAIYILPNCIIKDLLIQLCGNCVVLKWYLTFEIVLTALSTCSMSLFIVLPQLATPIVTMLEVKTDIATASPTNPITP